MAKTQKPLLFIDTNIFLDFYRAEGEASLSLLKHVESIPEGLIMTDQVEMEFLKNRQRVIVGALQSLKASSMSPFIPAYLSDSGAASKIEKSLNETKRRIDSLKKKLARILEKPGSHDPVFKVIKKAFSFQSPTNLKFSDAKRDKIFDRALKRFQRGFPPRKRDDSSIGDSVNWEWIIECAVDTGCDVIVVSRDGDFGQRLDGKHYLNDWLEHEFKERVSQKRTVEFTTSLAQALRRLAVPVTKAEEDEEKKIIAQQATTPSESPLKSIWDQLLSRVRQQSPFTGTYLSEAVPISLHEKVLTIGFEPEYVEYIDLVNNAKTQDRVRSALKEIGLDCTGVRFVRLPVANGPSVEPALSVKPTEDEVPF